MFITAGTWSYSIDNATWTSILMLEPPTAKIINVTVVHLGHNASLKFTLDYGYVWSRVLFISTNNT